MELQEKLDQVGQAFEAFKKANDTRLAEIEKKGHASAETIEKLEKADQEIEKLQDQIKSFEAALNRSNLNGASGKSEAEIKGERAEARAEISNGFLRKSGFRPSEAQVKAAGYSERELKSMSVQVDEDGGFLVTPEVSSEVVKKIFLSSPIRQLASVETISTDALEIIEDLDEAASGWVGETQARPETNTPKIKKISIPVHELYASPKATQKLLDDAAWNVEAWLSGKVAEKFGRDEATAFVTGTGIMKPKGFLSYDAGTGFGQVEQVSAAAAATIAGDDLIELQAALKDGYLPNATWLMHRLVQKSIRKLKNTVTGDYIWQPGLQTGVPNTILGSPVKLAEDMASSVAASALTVAYGDFKEGYQIVDRIGIRVIRDIYTAKPYVVFYTTKRVGGGVKNFEAIKILKQAAS